VGKPDETWEPWVREATDPKRAPAKPEALARLRVLDLSRANFGGLYCSSILAEFGAEVIRIEPPDGDPARRFTPFGLLHHGTGLPYLVEGRSKFHVTLTLEAPEGRELFLTLARRADVVIESFTPGTMDGWGIGYRQLSALNPRLIYCALATYGQFGPKAGCGKPDYDVTDQALSGIVWVTGEMETPGDPKPWEVPTKVASWLGWYAGGAWAAFAILLALRHRRRSGRGQLIDVSGAEGVMRMINYNIAWYHTCRELMVRVGNLDQGIYPYGFIRVKDGYIFIAGFSDVNFQAITTLMGRPDLPKDPRFDSFLKRAKLENAMALKEEMEQWSVRHTAEEILQMVLAYRGAGVVGMGRANLPSETLGEAHWWERGIFQVVDDPVYGKVLIQGQPVKMTETPPRVKWVCRPVGADNEFIYLKYLGLGRERLQALRVRGVL